MPAEADDLDPWAVLGTHSQIPFRPVDDDRRDVGQRLHIVDHGRFAVEAGLRREGGLGPGLAQVSL